VFLVFIGVVAHCRKSWVLIFLSCFLTGVLCLCLVSPLSAQDTPPPTQPQQPAAAPSPEKKPEEKTEQTAEKKGDQEKKHHRGALVVAVSPAIGSGIIPVLGYILPFQEKDKVSPPSVVGAAGLITNNGSRGFALGGDLYMKENRYELKAAYFHGNIDYNLYGVDYVNGNAGLKLPLEQTGQLFFIEFLRNIGWKVFVGGRFITGNSVVTIRPTSGDTPPIPPDVGVTTNLRALGMEVVRDTRPNRFYPVKGSLADFTGHFFAQSLGSKYSFQSYKVTFNKYWSLTDKQVLAYNGFFCATRGQPPFYGNCIYGTNSELRGYTAGRYLDRYMFCHAIGVSPGSSVAFRLGWLRWSRRGCSRWRRLPNESAPARRRHRRSIPAQQEVPRQSAYRLCMGQRQLHLEHGRRRSFLAWPRIAVPTLVPGVPSDNSSAS
jgi:hypothetical protein